MTNEQFLMECERLLTDLESVSAALGEALDIADELMPNARRYATPRELSELAGRAARLTALRDTALSHLA